MRSQTISARSKDQAQLPGTVDPTGWLAGLRPGATGPDHAGPGSESDTGGTGTAADNRTASRSAAGRRAAARRTERAQRTARRSARERQLRRLRIGADQQVRLDRPAEQPVPKMDRPCVEAVGVQGYRMGRWARLTLTMTALAAVVVIAASLTAGSAPGALVDVTVSPGDTLWSIATRAAPDRDPRAVIQEIRHLNDVSGTVLPVGVVLRVPASGE